MLKRTKKHTLYEVWSEDAAESVYVDRKPTREEVDALWKENWPNTHIRPQVFKEAHVYTQDPRPSFINEGLQKKGGVNPTPTNQRPPPPPPQPPAPNL